MKRLFIAAGMVMTIGFYSSCAQHDTESPDTSGSTPYNQPGVGVDTVGVRTPVNSTNQPNNNNDLSNGNQQVNTGDSSNNR